jgi:hypothetical protein
MLHSLPKLPCDTKVSKITTKDNEHDFYPKMLNHNFSNQKLPDMGTTKIFQECPSYTAEDLHHDPDNPSIFMKTIKERAKTM